MLRTNQRFSVERNIVYSKYNVHKRVEIIEWKRNLKKRKKINCIIIYNEQKCNLVSET